MQVVVIGAGVIGLSVATDLARRGVRVTVVEQDAPGTGTSATSYAWVNANNKEPRDYYELNLAGLEAHHRLAQDTDGNWIGTGGHVEVATEPAHSEELGRRVTRLQSHGYEAELITSARAQQLAPDLIIPPDTGPIAYFGREAYCYPQLYLAHLLTTAAELGVRVINGAEVKTFDVESDRPTVRLADGTAIDCDQVVSCVGRWTETLLAQADVTLPMATFEHPGDVTVGYLAVTNPLPVSLTLLVTTSQLNVRPNGGGRLMLQALDLDRTADPRAVPTSDSPVAEELLDRLEGVLRNTGTASIVELRVGQRAIPADGLTIAGPLPSVPWLYVVATHSGVTLAPLLGNLVAEEISGAAPQDLLTAFRPDRLLNGTVGHTPLPARRPGQQ
jgi:glycine/D-amino acid oxidase-like deaminating enzyme